MSMALYTNDEPTQIVRPLRDGEHMPLYTTAQLFFGVCHLVRVFVPPAPVKESKRTSVPWKTIEFKVQKAKDKFDRLAPQIMELLRQHKTNGEIAEQLKIPHTLIANYLRRNAELRHLSSERPRSEGYIKAKKETSANRFLKQENAIRYDVKDIGITAAAIKHKFDRRTLQRFLEAGNGQN